MKNIRLTSIIVSIVFILTCICGMGIISSASDEIIVVLDGKRIAFADQQPVIINNRMLVPMRAIFAAFGADVIWDDAAQTARATKDNMNVTLTIGSETAIVNGEKVILDVAAQIINDRTMVPLRFVGEALAAKVAWDSATSTVNITTDQPDASVTTSIPPSQAVVQPPAQSITTTKLTPDEKFAALPPGTSILAADAFMNASISGGSMASQSVVTISDAAVPFTKAKRFDIKQEAPNTYSIQMNLKNAANINKNDMLLAVFYACGISTTNKVTQMAHASVVMESTTTYNKSITYDFDLPVDSKWKKFYVPFAAIEGYTPGTSQFNIRLGYTPCVLEMAALDVLNYGGVVVLADMPSTGLTYIGRDPDAQWRKDAFARIEKIRKSDVEIKVIGANGVPIEGASVSINMTRSAFAWGTAVGNTHLETSTNTALKIQQNLVKYFNTVTMENSLKWPRFESGRASAIASVNKLLELGLTPRGHALVWDKFDSHLPTRLTALKGDATALQKNTMEHITDEATVFKGVLSDWDVVNETVNNHDMRDIVGDKAVADWFKQAKKADPYAKIYINETNLGGNPSKAVEDFKAAVKSFKSYGAPIEGIGVQAHFGSPFNPQIFLDQMDDLAKLAGELKITEFDFNTNDQELQADFTRDIIIASYSHPAFNGFIMWGFWDGAHWLKNAPLFNQDWTLKPSGEQYEELVLHTFRTDETAATNAGGIVKTRGFHGTYEVTVTYNGKEYKQACGLIPNTAGKLVFDVSKEPVPLPAKPPIQYIQQ